MKKVIFVFMTLTLIFACDNGLTQREQCERKVYKNDNALDPEFCVLISAGVISGEVIPSALDLFLPQCLNFQIEMGKCKKKSNLIPGNL